MKRLSIHLMLAAVLMMVFAPFFYAQVCRTFVRTPTVFVERPHVVEKVIVEKIKAIAAIEFVTPVLPIYNVPPAYGALYYPPQAFGAPAYGAGQAPVAAADPCAELRLKYGTLEQRLRALEGGADVGPIRRGTTPNPMERADTDPPTKGEPSGSEFVVFAAKNCNSCHEGTGAKTKGGGFVLSVGGKIAPLTPEQSGEVIRRLTLPHGDPKAMPKGKRLSADDKLQGVRLFVGGDEDAGK